ncbi:hypothetical protein ACYULU_13740 [Breznakiellaceae bacterium SP9]
MSANQKARHRLLLLLLALLPSPIFAFGAEEAVLEPQNPEWVLALTEFDNSHLGPARALMRDLLVRNLTVTLAQLKRHFRNAEEYAYYEGYALQKERQKAAQALAKKREERDVLLFKGSKPWTYEKALAAVDEEINSLQENLAKWDTQKPPIVSEPVFKLTEAGQNGNYPPPPAPGTEYQFCLAQKADAFIAGSVQEYHGRIYAELKLYTVYSRAFVYEDYAVFSIEDNQEALDRLGERLVAALSGGLPAAIRVSGTPSGATVLLDGTFTTYLEEKSAAQIIPYAPGDTEVDIFKDGASLPFHDVFSVKPGELLDLSISLPADSMLEFLFDVPDKEGTLVYDGALFLGKTPLTVSASPYHREYFFLESPGGETAQIVLDAQMLSRTQASLALNTIMPPPEGYDRINPPRRRMYNAYMRFWLALPAAFLMAGISRTSTEYYNSTFDSTMYDSAVRNYYISLGLYGLLAAATVDYYYRAYQYVGTAGDHQPYLIR